MDDIGKDDISKIVALVRASSDATSVSIDMRFQFTTAQNEQDFYQHIDHPDNSNSNSNSNGLTAPLQQGQYYVAGLMVTSPLNEEAIREHCRCYRSIASTYQGEPLKWRIKLG